MVINKTDNLFPGLLKEINDCPGKIYCLGNVELLNRSCVAVVGSRQMSDYGKEVIYKIVPMLAKKFVIVSGMAFGVDAEVGRVCVENGGQTIAVLAGGVDVVSPRGNQWLYDLILKNGGLIVSEWPDKTEPKKENFIRRNRIISGLCWGVVVIEGGKHSGSLATARIAAEQGREVYAVPGRITDPNSWTPNFLIKNGANSLTAGDMIEDNG